MQNEIITVSRDFYSSLLIDTSLYILCGHQNTFCRYHSTGTSNLYGSHSVASVKQKNNVLFICVLPKKQQWSPSWACEESRVWIVKRCVVFHVTSRQLAGLLTEMPLCYKASHSLISSVLAASFLTLFCFTYYSISLYFCPFSSHQNNFFFYFSNCFSETFSSILFPQKADLK